MKKQIFIILILFFILFACKVDNENNTSNFKIFQHFTSSERLLNWFDNEMPEAEISKITSLPGIQIMEENLELSITDSTNQIIDFEQDLKMFSKNRKEYKSIYGLNLAFDEKEKNKKLLKKIKSSNFDTAVINRAVQFFPDDYEIETSADIYYVLTGWEWGDAYVRKVEKIDGKYRITKNGKPTLIFNISLFTNLYGETTEKQFNILTSIMSHELFHFVFRNYQNQSSNYQKIPDKDYFGQLLDIIQNEGIAHYIDRKNNLMSDFSKYEKYQRENFDKLDLALNQLYSKNISDKTKQEILQNANVGKYWSKYGAISGMFMAYHIERLLGKEALTNTIRNGNESFIITYQELQKKHKELPELNFDLKASN